MLKTYLFCVLLFVFGSSLSTNLSQNAKLKADQHDKENFLEVNSKTNAKIKSKVTVNKTASKATQIVKTTKATPAVDYFNARVDGAAKQTAFPFKMPALLSPTANA